jgi:hypothetical protein
MARIAPCRGRASAAKAASASGAKAIVPAASHASAGSERAAADISAAHARVAQVQIFISSSVAGPASPGLGEDGRKAPAKAR